MARARQNRADRGAERCVTWDSTCAREAAPFERQPLEPSPRCERERVHTPGATTIRALAETFGVGGWRTLKALFLSTERGKLIFVVVRGDLDVSLVKLGSVVDSIRLRPVSEVQIITCGAVPGFASWIVGMAVTGSAGLEGVQVIADPSVFSGTDFAAGANEADYHLIHVDPRRDLAKTQEADFALASSGARCAT